MPETNLETARLAPARVERLHVKNYRALRDLELRKLSPLTVLLGPNGSGKSTVFDVFAFLSECFTLGLRRAWDRRNRFRELRSRGSDGSIMIEIAYRDRETRRLLTYHVEIDEVGGSPVVASERLRWTNGFPGRPPWVLDYRMGTGRVVPETNGTGAGEEVETLDSPELFAVSSLGQFARHPRVSALRRFITGWHLSYLTADAARGTPESGPQERLSVTGDNLPNVIQYLSERYPDRLLQILGVLAERVPQLETVDPQILADGRLLLRLKDAPFSEPILPRWASDGTLKMLAYLTVLYDPVPPPFLGIEEPENQLHPRLMQELAEECRNASGRGQVLVTTHSPEFTNAIAPSELWVLDRGTDGYTTATHVSDLREVTDMVETGGQLGDLWMQGYFGIGDPRSLRR